MEQQFLIKKLLGLRQSWFNAISDDTQRKVEKQMVFFTAQLDDHSVLDRFLPPEYGWDCPCACKSCMKGLFHKVENSE